MDAGYTVLKITKDDGAYIYASGAYDDATGATGAGGHLYSLADPNNWSEVSFVNMVSTGAVALPIVYTAPNENQSISTGTVIQGASGPTGDIRGEATGFVPIGAGASVSPLARNTTYSGAIYAIYEGDTTYTGKVGVGTTSISDYYEGGFTTNNLYEFASVFNVDTGDLVSVTTGSGVHRRGDVTLQFGLGNPVGGTMTSSAAIAQDPFISGQKISILDTTGGLVFPDYRVTTDSIFNFTVSQNADVFGTYTKDFGVRNDVVNYDGTTQRSEFYLYGNDLYIDNVSIKASGATFLNQSDNTGNFSPRPTGGLSQANAADAVKYFNNQKITGAAGISGQLGIQVSFENDPTYTDYGNLAIFAGTGENFETNEGSLLSLTPLQQIQKGQHFPLFPNDGIPQNTGLYLKLAVDTPEATTSTLYTYGPVTLERIPLGGELYLPNDGDNNYFGCLNILQDPDGLGGCLLINPNSDLKLAAPNPLSVIAKEGTYKALEVLSPDGDTPVGEVAGGPYGGIVQTKATDGSTSFVAESDSNFRGQLRLLNAAGDEDRFYAGVDANDNAIVKVKDFGGNDSIILESDSSKNAIIKGTNSAGVTEIKLDTNPVNTSYLNLNKLLFGADTPKGNSKFEVAYDNAVLAAFNSKINSTGCVIIAGSGHQISGNWDSIAGGIINNISGGDFNFIGGGSGIDVTGSDYSSSMGGYNNDILSSDFAIIAGGFNNLVSGAEGSVLGGGKDNTIQGINAVIAGGQSNTIHTGGQYSFIGAGGSNVIRGQNNVIAGGINHEISGDMAVIIGGSDNKIEANRGVVGGNHSYVQAGHTGAWVFSDSSVTHALSSGTNTLGLHFEDGVYVESTSGMYLNGNPVMTGASAVDVDTLQIVTDRGNTTTNSISVEGQYLSGVTGVFDTVDITGAATLTVTGNVGIGTANPSVPLHIATDAALKILLESDIGGGAQNDSYIDFNNRGDHWAIGSKFEVHEPSFRIASSSAIGTDDRLTIRSDGKVGIGTDTPLALLDVRGDISGSGSFLGTGIGNRITNNGTPYLLSGDAASALTLQDVCDNGNTTTGSIISSGPHISGVTGLFSDRLEVGGTGVIGDAQIGDVGHANNVAFAHKDKADFWSYALAQNTNGDTYVNYANGRALYFRENNSTIGGFNYLSDFFVDTDTLYVDCSEGSVGIGTTAPDEKLDIMDGCLSLTSGTTSDIYLNSDTSNQGEHAIKYGFLSSKSYPVAIVGKATAAYSRGTLEIRVSKVRSDTASASGTDKVAEFHSGKVETYQRLNVHDDLIEMGDSQNAGAKAFKFSNSENKAAIWSVPQGSYGRADMRFTVGDQTVGTEKTEADAIMRIAPLGGVAIGNAYIGENIGSGALIVESGVGIGVTDPTVALQVSGSTTLGAEESDATQTIRGSTILLNTRPEASPTRGVQIQDNGLIGFSAQGANGLGIFSNADTFLGGPNQASAAILIKNGGNVGIGLTEAVMSSSPYKLRISGDIAGTGLEDRITLNGTGYLLSGDVAGEADTLQTVTDRGATTTTNISGAEITGTVMIAPTGQFDIITTEAGNLRLGPAGSRVVLYDNEGNAKGMYGANWGAGYHSSSLTALTYELAYGIDNVKLKLEMDDPFGDNALALRNSTAAQKFNIYNTYTSTTDYERAALRWDDDVFSIGTETGNSAGGGVRSLDLRTSGQSALYIDSGTQNVGIGKTAPAYPLDVDGTIQGGTIYSNLFSVGNEGKVVSTATAGLLLQATAGSKPITFYTNVGGNTERMRIAADGSVGIGIDDPEENLEVSGNVTIGPASSGPGDDMSWLRIDGYDEHGIEMGWGTWTKWKIATKVNGALEIYNTGIQHHDQQLYLGKKDFYKQGNLMVWSTGSVLRAGHNGTTYPILDIGVQDAVNSYNGDAYIDVRESTSPPSRFHFKKDGEFIASGVSVTGTVAGTGAGGRITLNGTPYLLSGDAAAALTLQGVCDNDNSTTTSILSTGPHISGVTGLFSDRVGIGITDPARTLHIYEAATATDVFVQADSANAGVLYLGETNTAIYRPANTSDLRLFQGGADVLSIKGGEVGIGTTAPSDKLEVYANGANVALRIHEDAGTHEAKLHLRRGGNDWEIINNSDLAIEIEDTEVFRIDTDGNVGIGTADPQYYKLHLNDDDTSTLAIQCNGNNATGSKIRLIEGSANFLGAYMHYDGDTNKFNLGVHNTSNTTLADDTAAITIDRETAYVGIGSTSPTVELDVASTGFDGSMKWTHDSLFLHNTGYKNQIIVGCKANSPTGSYLRLTEGPNTIYQGGYIQYDGSNNNLNIGVNDGGTAFTHDLAAITIERETAYVGIGTNAPITQLDVIGTGLFSDRVGIGTDAPSEQLEVVGDALIDRILIVDGSSMIERDGSILRLYANAGTDITTWFGGHHQALSVRKSATDALIGINNGSPSYQLDVNGTGYFVNGVLGTGAGNRITNNGTPYLLSGDAAAALTLQDVCDNDNSTTTSILSTGPHISGVTGLFSDRVGIGTSAPSELLHLQDSSLSPQIRIDGGDGSSDGAAILGLYEQRNGQFGFKFKYDGADNRLDILSRVSDVDTARLTIDRSLGYVGIGTTAPAEELHVSGSSTTTVRVDGSAVNLEIQAQGSTRASVGTITNHPLRLVSNNTERLTILGAGNVGIGTTNPQGALHLHSALTRTLLFTNPTIGAASSDGTYMGTSATTVNFRIVNQEAGKITFGTNGTHRFDIDSNGRVGIGLPSSDSDLALATLDVRGDISGSGDFLGTGVGNRITNNGTPYLLSGDAASALTLQDVCDNGNTTTGSILSTGPHISGVTGLFSDRVGIGITDPTYPLQVDGSVFLEGDNRQIYFGGSNTFVGENSNSQKLQLRGGGSTSVDTVYIDSQGRMGFGTSVPTERITITDGSIQVLNSTTGINVGYSNTATKESSTALGYNNDATGDRSSTVGYQNNAGGNATAMGYQNDAGFVRAGAFGYLNTAAADSATALGASNEATGEYSTAVGYNNTAANRDSAFGFSNTSINNSTALGYSNEATGSQCTAVGYNNAATDTNSVAVGYNNNAYKETSTAAGIENAASGTRSTAVGYQNNTTATDATAIGKGNTASATSSTALGSINTASYSNATAVGMQNTASKSETTAIGYTNYSTGTQSTTLGYTNTANTRSTALGDSNIAAIDATAVGKDNEAHYRSTAVGYSNEATGANNSVAVGGANVATETYATALGVSNAASGEKATAVGYGNDAADDDATAVGKDNTAARSATAVGSQNETTDAQATAVGYNNEAAYRASALGYYNAATADNSTAVGGQVVVSGDRSSALGYYTTIGTNDTVEIGQWSSARAREGAVRIHDNGLVALTMRSGSAPTASATAAGYETSTSLASGMYTIQRNGSDYILYHNTGTAVESVTLGASEADTLQTVTDRGNTTTGSILSTGPHISGVTGLFSDKVGIGTSAPSEALQVEGNVYIHNSNATLKIQEGTAEAYTFVAGGTSLDIKADSTTSLSIYQNGYVGIGIDTPANPLDVVGTARLSSTEGAADGRLSFGDNVSRYIQGNSAELQIGSTINQIHFQKTDGVGEIASSAADGTTAIRVLARTNHTAGNVFEVVNDSSTQMVVDHAGDVGIGTYSPDSQLDVRGSGYFSEKVGIGTKTPLKEFQVVGDIWGYSSAPAGTGDAYSVAGGSALDGNTRMAGLRFDRLNDVAKFGCYKNTSFIEEGYIAITKSGDVGIGTTVPLAELHVHEADAGAFTFDGNADNLIVESNGNGGITIATAAASDSRIIFATPNDATSAEIKYSDANNLMTIGPTTPSDSLVLQAGNGAEAMRIDSAGNVGIGSTPTNKLDVIRTFHGDHQVVPDRSPNQRKQKAPICFSGGPEHAVYVRGTHNGSLIELPEYWSELVHADSLTVVLTPLGKHQNLYVKSKDTNHISVGGVKGSYDYVVYGERKDTDKLEVGTFKSVIKNEYVEYYCQSIWGIN